MFLCEAEEQCPTLPDRSHPRCNLPADWQGVEKHNQCEEKEEAIPQPYVQVMRWNHFNLSAIMLLPCFFFCFFPQWVTKF